eukprot:gene24660-10612_t
MSTFRKAATNFDVHGGLGRNGKPIHQIRRQVEPADHKEDRSRISRRKLSPHSGSARIHVVNSMVNNISSQRSTKARVSRNLT